MHNPVFETKAMNYFSLFFCVLLFAACGDDTDDQLAPPQISVRLTDGPGDYEKVIIDVEGVELRFADGQSVQPNTATYFGSYDLLELSNGIDTLIATGDVPAEELQEVRLILGDDNFVQIDSTLLDLRTPSATSSSLILSPDC